MLLDQNDRKIAELLGSQYDWYVNCTVKIIQYRTVDAYNTSVSQKLPKLTERKI